MFGRRCADAPAKEAPAPLLEPLNRRAHVTGMVRGQNALQALIDAFSGKAPLL